MGSVNDNQGSAEEPGYFPSMPESYFPQVSALGNGVAGEILREGSNLVGQDERPPHARSDSGDTSNSNSAGDEPPEPVFDGEDEARRRGARAHSSSSGATSWRSSEESVLKGGEGANSKEGKEKPEHAMSTLVNDLASFRLGARPPTRERRPGSSGHGLASEAAVSTSPMGSYAAAAAKAAVGAVGARPDSSGSSQSTAGAMSATGATTRSASMGAEGAPTRPPAPQKTHSDETRAGIKVETEA